MGVEPRRGDGPAIEGRRTDRSDLAFNGLQKRQRLFFRNELRSARAVVLADSEAYARPLHALERLGRFLDPAARSLHDATRALVKLASESPLADLGEWAEFQRKFEPLLGTVRDARNDVMHVGARARHLTDHAVEACLVLEDALQQQLDTVGDFMVANPVTAERWQPVSLVRQRMLESSFTFIPVAPGEAGGTWVLLADHQVARFLNGSNGRRKRLVQPLSEAFANGLEYSELEWLSPSEPLETVRARLGAQPLLVGSDHRPVGIITAFDLL